jgi:hypothetical protein
MRAYGDSLWGVLGVRTARVYCLAAETFRHHTAELWMAQLDVNRDGGRSKHIGCKGFSSNMAETGSSRSIAT